MIFKCDFKQLGPYMSLLSVILLLGFDVVPNVSFAFPVSQASSGPRRKIPIL